MRKRVADFLKGEIVSSVFYVIFGFCLIFMPEQMIQMICKIVFGAVMIGTGIYHIWLYAGDKERAGLLDLFTGVIVLVLGCFLFFNPQIIVKLLPYLFGAFVLVDNIWMLKGSWKLKKLGNSHWRTLLIGSAVFLVLGIVVMVYPFGKITDSVVFAGCVMLADGLADMVFLFFLRRGIKQGVMTPEQAEENVGIRTQEETEAAPEVDEGEREEELENEVIINGRWKSVPEDEDPVNEILDMEQICDKEEGSLEEETPIEAPEAAHSERETQTLADVSEEEVLEEWKD